MKKIISLSLILVIISSLTSMAATFIDVSEDYWAKTHIDAMFNSGIVTGDPNGKFRPEDNVTRGELCKMMLLASGKTLTYSSDYGNHWASPYAEALKPYVYTYENWFLKSPKLDDFVNRSEVAMLLTDLHFGASISYTHMMGQVKKTLSEKFKDYENIGGFAESVYYVVTNNLMNGYEDGYFHPEWKITRAELCAVLNRSFGLSGSINNSTGSVVTSSSPFNTLKNAIIAKGDYLSDGEVYISLSHDDTTIYAVYDNSDDTISFMHGDSENDSVLGLTLSPEDYPMFVLSIKGELILGGKHKNSRIIVEVCPYTSLKTQAVKVAETAYSVFDLLLSSKGINVQLSDFGVLY